MDFTFYKRLAQALATQFGENCEVVVHDLTGGDHDKTVVAIENGHVSHRQVGDGPSRIVLEALHQSDPSLLEDEAGYLMKTHDGRILKSTTIYIRDESDKPVGIFAINYDITEMLMAEKAIESILNHKVEPSIPERIPTNVNDLLDDLIEQSVAIVGKPVALMSKEDKIRAIQFLNGQGAFLVTRSGDKVSKYFGISKYTLYSYIDAKQENGKEA